MGEVVKLNPILFPILDYLGESLNVLVIVVFIYPISEKRRMGFGNRFHKLIVVLGGVAVFPKVRLIFFSTISTDDSNIIR